MQLKCHTVIKIFIVIIQLVKNTSIMKDKILTRRKSCNRRISDRLSAELAATRKRVLPRCEIGFSQNNFHHSLLSAINYSDKQLLINKFF